MKPLKRWLIALGIVGVFILTASAPAEVNVAPTQTRKRVFVTRLYTGQDNQTHSEEVEVPFTAGTAGGGDISKLLKITGAELHRISAGNVNDWHTAPRRQYVITLSGHGEIEVAEGKKISTAPGHILLAEDTTGKGHISRTVGSEDRVTLWLPLVEQTAK